MKKLNERQEKALAAIRLMAEVTHEHGFTCPWDNYFEYDCNGCGFQKRDHDQCQCIFLFMGRYAKTFLILHGADDNFPPGPEPEPRRILDL